MTEETVHCITLFIRMNEHVAKISPKKLMLTFLSDISIHEVSHLWGNNPFAIEVNGESFYVYIKNLSPAQLSNNNPDVWRIQYPKKDIFESFKQSENLFLLFGYDAVHRVYTTWNPYWCKQRANIGSSVSLYSRLSLQERVAKTGEIEKQSLNNGGEVICIPFFMLYQYVTHIRDYFPEETVFVAKGSSIVKRQQEAEESLSTIPGIVDYEVDRKGKLVSLSGSVIAALFPLYKGEEYPDYDEMISMAEKFYPESVNAAMTVVDWINLFDNTKWRKRPPKEDKKEEITDKPERIYRSLRVTEEDGTIIECKRPVDTFVAVIEKYYPDLLIEIDFGQQVISTVKMQDFPNNKRNQRQIKSGYWVSTHFSLEEKVRILQKISDELGAHLRIEVIETAK